MGLVPGKKFSLVGTPEGDEIKDPSGRCLGDSYFILSESHATSHLELATLPDVVNDLDVDFSADPQAAAAYANDHRNRRKIKEHSDQLSINVISPLREGKRLLVLDIDYSKNFALISRL